ncbi:MAG: DUF1326 domain-containing protein [Planctomycetes bacterium]|nr:DUF1326 domain-containing protein [Planctomycetota bacterium]
MRGFLGSVAMMLIGSSVLGASPTPGVKGEYLEAHTTNLWASAVPTSPGETTHQAVLAWKVAQGAFRGTRLDNLSIVAVVFADRPLMDRQAQTRVHLLVDSQADTAQQMALVQMATALAPKTIYGNVASVTPAEIRMLICCGCAAGYADLTAGTIHVKTRRITDADKLRYGDVKQGYSVLGDLFYRYSAFTEEYAYGGGAAEEECRPFVLKDLCSAAVGGFSR